MKKTKKGKKDKKEKFVMVGYPVGDFLIRVKNAALARQKEVVVQRTKLIEATAKALVKEGYLDEVKKEGEDIKVRLTFRAKEPEMLGLKLISKPGLRVYVGVEELAKRRKPSTIFLSTPNGVVTGKDAIKGRVGGEAIFEIW